MLKQVKIAVLKLDQCMFLVYIADCYVDVLGLGFEVGFRV